MVEPQSPLHHVRRALVSTSNYVPEFGNDLIAAVRRFLVLLGSTLGDLEALIGEDRVAGVRAATDLSAVLAVTQDLGPR